MSAKIQKKKRLNTSKSKVRPAKKAKSWQPTGKKRPAAAPIRARPVKMALKIAEDPRVKLAREQYEAGVGLLSGHKYEKAIAVFEKVLQAPSVELVERARVHISICQRLLERKAPTIKTAEEHYNYAVAQINAGKLADAEDHLHKAMK